MSDEGDEWDEIRDAWQRLKRSRLSSEDVFDDLAEQRIGASIAMEATSSPERVLALKRARRAEAYYLLQAADAQHHAQRALSSADKEAWLRLAHNWLKLLSRLREQSFKGSTDPEGTERGHNKRTH
jgi:hypothetical protein